MKDGQAIQQGDWFSLYYDGELHTRQFKATIDDDTLIDVLSELMPNYRFTIIRA